MDQRDSVLLRYSGLLLLALCGFGVTSFAQEPYKPLFSDAVLQSADPESRARLEALNERNRQRWLGQRAESARPVRPAQPEQLARPATPAAPAAAGKLYRITDAQGNVRFSDQYVPGAKEVSVAVPIPSAQSRAEHAARQREQAVALEYFDERNQRRAKELAAAQERQAQAARHKAQCQELFVDIQDNRRGGFVFYDVGDDGERSYLSDAELAARTDAMEADYRKHCGELPPIGR